jgi:type II secretory pathway predicted ATPase ExeA
MDYLEYFELSREPFSNSPESRFYFNSDQHSEASIRLRRAVDSRKGLAMLIGEVGTGKTTLARKMLETLPEAEYESALMVVIHSGVTADWLLQKIALQIGVEGPEQDKIGLLTQLYKRLIEIKETGRHAVVMVDEAQMLGARTLMEEFRGLLNLEHDEQRLISFIFYGLPEIEEMLRLDPALAQRVDLRCRLKTLNQRSTELYVDHRLKLAGAKRPLLTQQALLAIHAYSGGTPRVINTLADNALFEAFLQKLEGVDQHMIEAVAFDLGLSESRPVADSGRSPGTLEKHRGGGSAALSGTAEFTEPVAAGESGDHGEVSVEPLDDEKEHAGTGEALEEIDQMLEELETDR